MKSSKVFFLIILSAFVVSGLILGKKILASNSSTPSFSLEKLSNTLKRAFAGGMQFKLDFDTDLSPGKTLNASPSDELKPTPTPTPSSKTTTKNTPKPTEKPIPPSNQNCYKYTIPHLDGSSSSLCYSQSDYQSLQTLGNQFISAKNSQEFYLSVANSFYDSADEFGSDFFRKAGDEAKAKADNEQGKVGEISIKMYTIEARGW